MAGISDFLESPRIAQLAYMNNLCSFYHSSSGLKKSSTDTRKYEISPLNLPKMMLQQLCIAILFIYTKTREWRLLNAWLKQKIQHQVNTGLHLSYVVLSYAFKRLCSNTDGVTNSM